MFPLEYRFSAFIQKCMLQKYYVKIEQIIDFKLHSIYIISTMNAPNLCQYAHKSLIILIKKQIEVIVPQLFELKRSELTVTYLHKTFIKPTS